MRPGIVNPFYDGHFHDENPLNETLCREILSGIKFITAETVVVWQPFAKERPDVLATYMGKFGEVFEIRERWSKTECSYEVAFYLVTYCTEKSAELAVRGLPLMAPNTRIMSLYHLLSEMAEIEASYGGLKDVVLEFEHVPKMADKKEKELMSLFNLYASPSNIKYFPDETYAKLHYLVTYRCFTYAFAAELGTLTGRLKARCKFNVVMNETLSTMAILKQLQKKLSRHFHENLSEKSAFKDNAISQTFMSMQCSSVPTKLQIAYATYINSNPNFGFGRRKERGRSYFDTARQELLRKISCRGLKVELSPDFWISHAKFAKFKFEISPDFWTSLNKQVSIITMETDPPSVEEAMEVDAPLEEGRVYRFQGEHFLKSSVTDMDVDPPEDIKVYELQTESIDKKKSLSSVTENKNLFSKLINTIIAQHNKKRCCTNYSCKKRRLEINNSNSLHTNKSNINLPWEPSLQRPFSNRWRWKRKRYTMC